MVKQRVCLVFVGVDRQDCMSSPKGMDKEVNGGGGLGLGWGGAAGEWAGSKGNQGLLPLTGLHLDGLGAALFVT